MPRLSEVRRDDAHPFAQTMYRLLFGDRDPVDEPGTSTGSPGNWWTVMAQSPDMFDHMVAGFQFYRSPDRQLSVQLRELAQTRTGWAAGSQFVFSQHCKAARECGIPEEKIEAIPSWTVADCWDSTERAVLAWTDALVLQNGRVADEVFEALHAVLSEVEILELTYIVCTYDLHAKMTRAFRLEFDDVDERIVEIPGGALDPMAVVEDPMAVVDDA